MYCNLATDKLPGVHEQIGDQAYFIYNARLIFRSFLWGFKGDKCKISVIQCIIISCQHKVHRISSGFQTFVLKLMRYFEQMQKVQGKNE